MEVLNVDNVVKVYRSGRDASTYTALDGVSFTVGRGEFTGVMGPSGAGKTTLLNIVATIDEASSGGVSVCGKDITHIREPELSDFRRDCLGFIFQDYNLLDTLSLRDNIALPLVLARKPPKKIGKAVQRVAEDLGITELLDKYPNEVSGGQRQRAAAARALVNEPQLILADEPTGALDSKSSGDLLSSLQRLNQTRGATILMVTHDPFAASFCRRILFIKDGRLFKELESDGRRQAFYDDILGVLSTMGGARQ